MAAESARGPISRIEWVEGELRRAILAGEFAPGERLLTVQLAERYSVSPTPLREVLHRFSGEGLVEFIPQKGARVSELTVQDAAELADLRSILEAANLRAAAEHLTADDRAAIGDASDRLIQAWRADDGHTRPAELAYREFYVEASRANPSRRLRQQTALMREFGSRYRLAGVGLRADQLVTVHIGIREALLRGASDEIAAATSAEIHAFAAAFPPS